MSLPTLLLSAPCISYLKARFQTTWTPCPPQLRELVLWVQWHGLVMVPEYFLVDRPAAPAAHQLPDVWHHKHTFPMSLLCSSLWAEVLCIHKPGYASIHCIFGGLSKDFPISKDQGRVPGWVPGLSNRNSHWSGSLGQTKGTLTLIVLRKAI